MGRKSKKDVWCPFPDCFHCPHPDCIKQQIFQPMPPPLPPKKPKARRVVSAEQKEKNRARARAYYQQNKATINAQRRAERASRKEYAGAK